MLLTGIRPDAGFRHSRLTPGSIAWLLAQEMRLLWRGSIFARVKSWLWLAILTATAQGFGLAGASGALRLQLAPADRLLTLTLGLSFIFGLMLAQAIQRATELLDGQADLGWLLSSPLPPQRVLALRLVALAGSVALNWIMLLGPVATGLALFGHPVALMLLPVLACLGLLAASGGAAVTFVLVPLAGLRRTRTLANAAATLVGAVVFLCAQWRTLLSAQTADAVWNTLSPGNPPAGAIWWPAQILLGETWKLLPLAAGSLAALMAASFLLRRWFASGATQGLTVGGEATTTHTRRDRRFAASLAAALLRKEILLLRRTPGLAGLALYYTIYLIPAAAALWRGGSALNARPFAAAPVLAAGELARLFMSACMVSEAATDLVATAPVRTRPIEIAKLEAATIGVATILGLPIAGLAILLPSCIPAMALGLTGVVFCNLLLGLWRPMPIRRADLRRDRKGWGGLVNLAGMLLSILWSTATWLALRHSRGAVVPVVIALAALPLLRPRAAKGSSSRQA